MNTDIITIGGIELMAPAGEEHNVLMVDLCQYLKMRLEKEFLVLADVFRYLTEDQINLIANLEKADVGRLIEGLRRFGADDKYIQNLLDTLSRQKAPSGTYAPDVCVLRKEDRGNRFAVPLWVAEILSPATRQDDLYYRSYFYETIGVPEYVILVLNEVQKEGQILKAYHRMQNVYQERPLNREEYLSPVLSISMPRRWKLEE
jgi:hypothetical protein